MLILGAYAILGIVGRCALVGVRRAFEGVGPELEEDVDVEVGEETPLSVKVKRGFAIKVLDEKNREIGFCGGAV